MVSGRNISINARVSGHALGGLFLTTPFALDLRYPFLSDFQTLNAKSGLGGLRVAWIL